jgi:hypothetical protein
MKYECEICKYITDRKLNFERHNKSKKHISNVENTSCISKCENKSESKSNPNSNPKCNSIFDDKKKTVNNKKYNCVTCGHFFNHRQNLYKHKKYHCKNIKNEEKLINENKELKEKNEKIEKQNEELLKLANTNAETANITAKSNKKTVHIMTHAMKNFSDTPVIQQLSHNKSKKLLTEHAKDSTHSVEDLMIHHQENGILHKYLGNMLITHYRNVEDPSQQPLWSSDTARLNFILKQVVGDSSEWVNDKKGIKFNKLVIKPILDKVRDMLSEKITELIKKNKKIYMEDKEDEEADDVQENMHKILHCKVIMSEITKEILHTEIIKYICPYLNFETDRKPKKKVELKKKPKKKNKTKIVSESESESDSEDEKPKKKNKRK